KVAETHVHRDLGVDAGHGPSNHIEELLGSTLTPGPSPGGRGESWRMTGKARLIELNEIDTGRDELLHLCVDDRQQGSRDLVAVLVDIASLDAAGEREWAWDRHLGRRGGVLPKATIFFDESEAARRLERCDADVFRALIVRRRAPLPGGRQRLETLEI